MLLLGRKVRGCFRFHIKYCFGHLDPIKFVMHTKIYNFCGYLIAVSATRMSRISSVSIASGEAPIRTGSTSSQSLPERVMHPFPNGAISAKRQIHLAHLSARVRELAVTVSFR